MTATVYPEVRHQAHQPGQHGPSLHQQPDRTHHQRLDWADEAGAQTAEYGIVTLAAVGFAGVLAVILAGSDVQGLLLDLVKGALSFG